MSISVVWGSRLLAQPNSGLGGRGKGFYTPQPLILAGPPRGPGGPEASVPPASALAMWD